MENAKLKTRTHKNVMSRVSNPAESHFKPKYVVTRHATASSGAKPISSTVSNTSGFCDLPIALNDYIPETVSDTVKRRTFVVKPKKTIKSLPPTVPPTVLKTRYARVHTNLYCHSSAPTVLNVLNSGRTLNSSTENSQRLKEIKDEIKAYHKKEQSMKLSDSLHRKFGLKLHDDGDVADKGIQMEQKDSNGGTPRE
ncbi:uncharacterized protein LOC121735059 [Aricia agestis]|uniref:uncharacterized protein LOC121735059 n=1 Tax=Aricia agestis TaxID=91739 RepID=UPI001C205D51|nr:uncharacterized protein LOC121735059 [Aricia agestis]